MSIMKFLAVSLLVCALMVQSEADPLPEPEAEPEGEIAFEAQEDDLELIKRTLTCPSGWNLLGESCYYYYSTYKTWAQAERICQGYGGNLASVHSNAEYHNLQWLVVTMTYKHGPAWIGGHDAEEEGTWLWSDGSLFNYRYYGTMDNAGSKQHCLQMNFGENKYWDDIECSTRLPSICITKSIKSA
ncbi:ladderlectin-like [Notolabrus celidotus]|uniref:ladderlectin-like n=1 Tax=Notolabrus celidotus TaxID=1203425 RepID=UPI0014908A54|nr:ladderlectin-like [Notolabrus celidotus]